MKLLPGFILLAATCFAEPPRTDPAALLREAAALGKARTDSGDARTTAALRLGATMRLAGLKGEARAALEECAALVARMSDADSRDETKVELAREFLLLGATERAGQLASELTEREYDLLAQFIFARTALEARDPAGAARAVRDALTIARDLKHKQDRMGRAMLCSLGRIARELNEPELALRCEEAIADDTWKSALTGERALELARAGYIGGALELAAQCADPHMAVLAQARVLALLHSRGIATDSARTALLGSAAKITAADKREFALRIAAGIAGSAGDVQSAARIAAEIRTPSTRLLALCPFVEASSFEETLALLSQSAPDDVPALAEVLAAACGSRGLREQALAAAANVPRGWPRIRALCDAVRHFKMPSAAPLLAAAADELPRIAGTGWRCVGRSQLALAARHAGDTAAAAEQLALACGDALRIESADDRRAVLPQALEAALACGQREIAARTILEALKHEPEPALRDVLVPMLIDSGEVEAALAELARAPLGNDFARRFAAWRLAKAGRCADAVRFSSTLNERSRAEALSDIALAQLPPAAPAKPQTRRVGLSLHGGWIYWTSRLERMGIGWDVMPFTTPYEEGAAGLAARYTMLGYPGAGDHHIQCSAAGIEQVREFLRDGGGLFGICAGQLFATAHPNGHRFVPADFYYLRGGGAHEVQMAARQPASAGLPARMIITRRNGDFLIPRPGCDVLGWYDDENLCAAVIAARYGLGRVVVSSPHPEGDNSFSPTDRLCIEVTRWLLEGAQ